MDDTSIQDTAKMKNMSIQQREKEERENMREIRRFFSLSLLSLSYDPAYFAFEFVE
jgi:hypothetical protein